jgi:hypothetical protein
MSKLFAFEKICAHTRCPHQFVRSLTSVHVQQMPWVPFLFSAVFGTVVAQCSELVAVGKVPASQASLTLSLITVWGLMFGAIFNHDRLTPLAWAGAAIIMAATIVPKVLDVIADLKQKRNSDSDSNTLPPLSPPISMTSEELVRTTVSATMLAATPVMTDAGLLATGRAVATKAMTTAMSTEGASLITKMAAETATSTGASVAGMAEGLAAAEAAVLTAGATEAVGVGAAEAGAAAAAGALGAAAGSMVAGTAAAASAGGASAAAGLAVAGGAAAAAAAAVVTGAVSPGDVSTVLNSAADAIVSGADTLNSAGTGSIVGATEAVISGVRSVGEALSDPNTLDPSIIAATQAAVNAALPAADATPHVASSAAEALRNAATPAVEAIKDAATSTAAAREVEAASTIGATQAKETLGNSVVSVPRVLVDLMRNLLRLTD